MTCLVCGAEDADRPMCFRGEQACCDRCRKIITGEVRPTEREWALMDRGVYLALKERAS